STVENTGNDGVPQPVTPGQVSVTASPATPAIPAPQQFIDAMRDLNSPSPWNPQALYLPAMQALIDAGVVSPNAVDKWKQEKATPTAAGQGGGEHDAPPPPDFGEAQQKGQLFKGRLTPKFQN
ncbi:MAG TPA: hypothetical protein VF678_15700, partial [bacterium]